MINQSLEKLYAKHWDSFWNACQAIPESDSPSNPLLIRLKDEEAYKKADLRLMFIGQETNKWYPSTKGMEQLLYNYQDFYKREKKKGQFWRAVKQVVAEVEAKFPGKTVDYSWSNCLKVGRKQGKGKPIPEVREIEQQYFNVLKEEIDILKPDIVLFFSGPNYDHIIQKKLKGVAFNAITGFKQRQLARVQIPGVKHSFRTYHPGYLYRNNFEEYLDAILKQIAL